MNNLANNFEDSFFLNRRRATYLQTICTDKYKYFYPALENFLPFFLAVHWVVFLSVETSSTPLFLFFFHGCSAIDFVEKNVLNTSSTNKYYPLKKSTNEWREM